jgi:hypothetical protein
MNELSGAPALRVVRGTPTDEELAALVIAVTALGGPATEPRERRSAWADRAALMRRSLRPGPTSWRTSSLPG